MKYSVALQPPFDFSPKWMVAGALLVLAAIALWLALRADWKGRPLGLRRPGINLLWKLRLLVWKRRCLWALARVERAFRSGRVDERAAAQGISREVRRFAEAVTEAPITHLVHSELEALRIPGLSQLIGELYGFEFARSPGAKFDETMRKSKELIRRWE